MPSAASVPLALLQEAIDMTVSLELNNGQVLNGTLAEADNDMNVTLTSVTRTTPSGKTSKESRIFVRSAEIVFFQLPDALELSPSVQNVVQELSLAEDGRGDGKGFGAARKRAKTEK